MDLLCKVHLVPAQAHHLAPPQPGHLGEQAGRAGVFPLGLLQAVLLVVAQHSHPFPGFGQEVGAPVRLEGKRHAPHLAGPGEHAAEQLRDRAVHCAELRVVHAELLAALSDRARHHLVVDGGEGVWWPTREESLSSNAMSASGEAPCWHTSDR